MDFGFESRPPAQPAADGGGATSSRIPPPPDLPRTSSRPPSRSRCWSISGPTGAARASSWRRSWRRSCSSYGGKVRLVKINIDQHPAIAGQLRIQSLPTVYAFRDGRPLDGFMGAQPESQVSAFIDRLLGEDGAPISPRRWPLPTRRSRRRPAGRSRNLCRRAAGGSAERGCHRRPGALLPEERRRGARRADDRAGAARKAQDAAVASVRAALDLAKALAAGEGTRELKARLAANPADHQARFDLAVALAARGDKEEAVDHLLEMLPPRPQLERAGGAQAARAAVRGLGSEGRGHLDGRRRLSSLMFS